MLPAVDHKWAIDAGGEYFLYRIDIPTLKTLVKELKLTSSLPHLARITPKKTRLSIIDGKELKDYIIPR